MPAAGSTAVTLEHGVFSFVNQVLAFIPHEGAEVALPGERDMMFFENVFEQHIEFLLCPHLVDLICDALINCRLFREPLAVDFLQFSGIGLEELCLLTEIVRVGAHSWDLVKLFNELPYHLASINKAKEGAAHNARDKCSAERLDNIPDNRDYSDWGLGNQFADCGANYHASADSQNLCGSAEPVAKQQVIRIKQNDLSCLNHRSPGLANNTHRVFSRCKKDVAKRCGKAGQCSGCDTLSKFFNQILVFDFCVGNSTFNSFPMEV